ncbi:sigma factor-like helix-turn-helix DNA-binding protein [Clostridium perfringens]|uniref:sigma factor-like helix-turn-helix DNA-binding protein n=1 Tax=Clostridium perfringens TaxID=1502 RepID=UPI0024BC4088|nr:sigma factor-like helix-turn-helix DNA-binding protein [Clostridium perfringens]
MDEYIELGYGYMSLNGSTKEYSELIKIQKNGKVDIGYIRNLYINNRMDFFRLIDEVVLRGGKFNLKKEQNILKNIELESDKFLYKFIHKNEFEKIDFYDLGLGNIVNRYNIKNDCFFNFIYLDAFKILNRNIDIKRIEEEFLRKGFEVLNKESFEEKYIDKIKKMRNENSEVEDLNNLNYEFNGINKTVSEFTEKIKYSQNLKELNLLKVNLSEIFSQGAFLEYCKSNEKYVLEDILSEIDSDFIGIPKIGKYKSKKLLSELNSFLEIYEKRSELLSDFDINIKDIWFKKIKNKPVNSIKKVFKIENEFGILDNKNFSEIQLKNINNYEVDDIIKSNFIEFILKINSLNDINLILKEQLKKIKDKEILMLNKRYLNGDTLEEIGALSNITRERVRQILKKAASKLNEELIKAKFKESLAMTFIEEKYINIDDINVLVDDENLVGFKVFLEFNSNIVFDDMEFISLYDNQYLNNLNEKLIDYLDDEFILDEELDSLNEIYEIVGFKSLEKYKIEKHLIKLGYIKQGKFFSKERLNLSKGYELLLKYFIDSTIRLDEQGAIEIKKKFMEVFDIDITDKSCRSIEARIVDNINLFCVDSREYIHIDNLNISEEGKELVDKFTTESLKEREVTTAQDIIKVYGDELNRVNIDNKYKVYSIIKYYFNDRYITGKGNTMSIAYISNKENIKKNREDFIEEFIINNGGLAKRKEIISNLKWEPNKFDDTITKSNKFIKLGKFIILSNSSDITSDIKKRIIYLIELSIRNYGAVSTGYIYSKSMLDSELYKLFTKYNAKSGQDIISLIKFVDPSLRGFIHILYREDSNVRNVIDIVKNNFSNVHKKKEIRAFLRELGYRDTGVSNIFRSLIEEKEYYYISSFDIVNKKNLMSIGDDILNKVFELLTIEFEDNEYLVVNNISRLRRKLPRIDYTWEPELIESLVDGKGYRSIKRIYYDYIHGTDRVILVKENSKITKFDELIKHILINEYYGVMHIDHIYKFLIEKGVIYNNLRNRTIPYEVLSSDLFEIDSLGRFKIKE